MATEIRGFSITLVAAADLSEKRYLAGIIDANGKCAVAGAAANADGIIQDPVIAGRLTSLMTSGESMAVYGGNVAAGDPLTPNADGKLIKATVVGSAILGKAIDAGAADEIHTILVSPNYAITA